MTKKVFKLGISTCPNDTFAFDALINKKIDTDGIDFEVVYADIKELNKLAFKKNIDIVKVSFHAFAYISETYKILRSGNALGNNCGPLIIAKRKFNLADFPKLKIAIPGNYTSANLLLKLFAPKIGSVKEMVFSEIEKAVLDGTVDCGLIIHESRFTYQSKGLLKIVDLGEWWENWTKLPIPLGGIIAKREMDKTDQEKISSLIKKSIEFAYHNPSSSIAYIQSKAQEIDIDVIQKHIAMYVNAESVELSKKGEKAIELLLEKAQQKGSIPKIFKPIFV